MEDADQNLREFGKNGGFSLIILMGMKVRKKENREDKTFALIPTSDKPDKQTQEVMTILLRELKGSIKLIPEVRTQIPSWTFYEQTGSASRKVIIGIIEKTLGFQVAPAVSVEIF